MVLSASVEACDSGVPSVDATFGDLLYDVKTRGAEVYLYIHSGKVCGYVSFEKKGKKVFIDALVSSKTYRGKNVGTALIRWAENWARSSSCEAIELRAINDRVDWYRKKGFAIVDGQKPIAVSSTVQFILMRRQILYHMGAEDEY